MDGSSASYATSWNCASVAFTRHLTDDLPTTLDHVAGCPDEHPDGNTRRWHLCNGRRGRLRHPRRCNDRVRLGRETFRATWPNPSALDGDLGIRSTLVRRCNH